MRNREDLIIEEIIFLLKIERGSGRRRAISISNTRKITARRKNRIEKGRRALFLGSNPHSKGEDFSRSINEREEINIVILKMAKGIIILKIIENIIVYIH